MDITPQHPGAGTSSRAPELPARTGSDPGHGEGARPWHRVRVHLGGAVFEDAVRGADREDALREAEANWCSETPYTPATSIVYCGLDD